jgi:hypothetical protein
MSLQHMVLHCGPMLRDQAAELELALHMGPSQCRLCGVGHQHDDAREARSLSHRTPSHGGAYEESPSLLAVNLRMHCTLQLVVSHVAHAIGAAPPWMDLE